jgi:hypothetical protein
MKSQGVKPSWADNEHQMAPVKSLWKCVEGRRREFERVVDGQIPLSQQLCGRLNFSVATVTRGHPASRKALLTNHNGFP